MSPLKIEYLDRPLICRIIRKRGYISYQERIELFDSLQKANPLFCGYKGCLSCASKMVFVRLVFYPKNDLYVPICTTHDIKEPFFIENADFVYTKSGEKLSQCLDERMGHESV